MCPNYIQSECNLICSESFRWNSLELQSKNSTKKSNKEEREREKNVHWKWLQFEKFPVRTWFNAITEKLKAEFKRKSFLSKIYNINLLFLSHLFLLYGKLNRLCLYLCAGDRIVCLFVAPFPFYWTKVKMCAQCERKKVSRTNQNWHFCSSWEFCNRAQTTTINAWKSTTQMASVYLGTNAITAVITMIISLCVCMDFLLLMKTINTNCAIYLYNVQCAFWRNGSWILILPFN